MKPMDLLKRFRRVMLSADVPEEEFAAVWPDVIESNRLTVSVFSMVSAVFLLGMLVTSFLVPSLSGNRIAYAVCLLVMLGMLAASHGLDRSRTRACQALTYLFICVLLAFGIAIGTVGNVHEITATYIALLLAIPLLFGDRPWRMWVLIESAVAVFIVAALWLKDPITWASDIVNSIVFGTLGALACTRVIMIKVRRYCLENKVRYMAEVDLLTGLKNRNSYEQRLSRDTQPKPDTVFCVYADVNGLHELNNSQGHEAGDRMLQYIAGAMQRIFGAQDTYRVGGDEYIAFGENRSETEIAAMVRELSETVGDAGYHAAVGWVNAPYDGLKMEEMVKEAERRMYADKQRYYEQNGIGHRRMPRSARPNLTDSEAGA